ncbi:Heme A synthase [Rubripirellula amarantea]|uniref:Heme A synthase n=1 Tax=Rubripirellula amarantea TaxID=2527999 RepID=A0A5C5WSX5_9BACT|nr:COX15/CtaA family protein [Rubripirellula amarantea]TWT53173.1 Heme A synthase [Rubripirellula amarantea]
MSKDSLSSDSRPASRALHRLVVLAVCLVWPLIWVGGLVTTYDAGMAVPDWPETYGDNLFLYPYQTWLAGPFDLFIEHGHRLLGAVVGLVAIGIVVAAFWIESRRWVQWLCVALLVMVIAQGLLGGMRVVLGDRTLAMVHGCFGPAFFAVCVAVAVVTSRYWRDGDVVEKRRLGKFPAILAGSLVGLSYTQLMLGAMLRHVQPAASPGHFAGIVSTHIMMAFLLWAITAFTWGKLRRCGDLTLSRPSSILIGLVGLQIALGIGTWVVNYGWPSFMMWVPESEAFLIRAKGFVDSIIVTAHVATGSLILAVSTMLWVRLLRHRYRQSTLDHSSLSHSSQRPRDTADDVSELATT